MFDSSLLLISAPAFNRVLTDFKFPLADAKNIAVLSLFVVRSNGNYELISIFKILTLFILAEIWRTFYPFGSVLKISIPCSAKTFITPPLLV
jgi:hypothetical protein